MAEKKVNFELVEKDHEAYAVLEAMLANHPHLAEANIVLAWRKGLKENRDGHLMLGKCVKVSDLNKEVRECDFIILLNAEAWPELTPAQQNAVMDHELMHAAVSYEKDGVTPKRDERGRIVYRSRQHDLSEFRDVVKRHGLYLDDVRAFVEAALKKGEANESLFAGQPSFKDEVRQLLKDNKVEFEENVLPISDAM